MKFLKITSIFLVFSLAILSSHAQEELKSINLNRTVVSLSPFNMIAGQFQLGLEKDFNQGINSLMLQGSIILNDYTFGGEPSFGTQAELHYRYKFLVSNNPQRRKEGRQFRFDFYAGPFAQYQYLQSESSYTYFDEFGMQHFVDERLRMNSIGGGVIMGTRFIFMDRLTLDIYAGGGFKYTFNDKAFDNDAFYYSGSIFMPGRTAVMPKGNIQIGVAF